MTEVRVCPHPECPSAGVAQPLDNFGRNDSRHNGKAYYCRRCASRLSGQWKKAHPEQDKQYRREYMQRNRARNRAARAAYDAAAQDETRHVDTD